MFWRLATCLVAAAAAMATTPEEAVQLRAVVQNLQQQLAAVQLNQQQQAQQQAQANAAQAAAAPPEEKQLQSIVDVRLLQRLPAFTGEDGDWRQWSFVFESMAGLVHLDALLDHCVAETEVSLVLGNQTPMSQGR